MGVAETEEPAPPPGAGDLITFMNARLDEDEAGARAAANFSYGVPDWCDEGDPDGTHIARHDPARVLREVEAKRKRLAAYTAARAAADRYDDQYMAGVASGLADAIRGDAGAWADHPDYKQEWST